jgi:hypothetical protein
MGRDDNKKRDGKPPPALASAVSGAMSGAIISACVQVRTGVHTVYGKRVCLSALLLCCGCVVCTTAAFGVTVQGNVQA